MTQAHPGKIEFIDLKTQYAALREDINARIQRVLDHGRYILGPEVAEMEQHLAAMAGVRHCVSVASGTEALLIALMALDLHPGDEVITTPFTFAATAECIVLLGGKPVFVDVDPETGNISADLIEAAISPRTRAVMPVSLYGQPADMDQINDIARRHGNIPVIEDAAQSFGAVYRGHKSCGLSTIGCTSFFPSKPLGCYGDGGALFTDDDQLASAFREIRVHGQSQRYVHTRVGVGGRMDTLQCAVILAKLGRFEWEIGRRLEIGAHYNTLVDQAGIARIRQSPDRSSVFAQYTVMVDNRSAVQASLERAGIPTAVHYPVPLNQQPAYRHLCCSECTPNAAALALRVLSLPMHPDLPPAEQQRIVDALATAVRNPG